MLLISNGVDLEPGMTDCFHVGELIPRPQNDFLSASAAHLTVTNTWMNTHTELKLPADSVPWLNSALCGGNGKTSVLKQWVIEQMDCGRVGWIQDGAVAGMQAGESLVNMLTPMAFEVALMTTLWLAYMEASMVAPMVSMVAPMASMVAPTVASMAPLASMMMETLDWWKQMTAESRNDGKRVDEWTHKIREGRVVGLFERFVHERADGLTHKIREEPIAGWTLFVDMVQVVTWARTKRRASLVDLTAASMASVASVASMATLMVTMMVR